MWCCTAGLDVRRHARLCAPDACRIFHGDRRMGSWNFPVFVRGLGLGCTLLEVGQPRAWASRSPRPSRDPPETPGSSRRCPGGRCCASTRSPRASWRQSQDVLPFRRPASTSRCCTHALDGPVRLQIDQAPRARNRRMIGRRLVHGQPQKAGPPTSPSQAPRNPAFRVDAFEVADQQSAEVAPGCQVSGGPSASACERVTQAFDEPIDVVPVEQRRQPRVETDGPASWAGPTSRSTAAVDPCPRSHSHVASV